MKKNRELLHKLLVKDSRIKPGYSDFDAFESHYFDSENNVKKIYDVIIVTKYKTGPKKGQVYYTKPIKNFYKDYVCDLEWAKTTNYCVGGDKPEEQEYTPEEKTISTTQQQQNLVNKGYFIGTSGPNKNGVDGIPGKKTKEAQHALDSGIDSTSYNNIYKQQNPDLVQTIENIFGKQEPKQIQTGGQTQGSQNQTGGQAQGSSTQTVTQPQNSLTPQQKAQVQKARVIKTIHPKNW
jgi:hypothetical protein